MSGDQDLEVRRLVVERMPAPMLVIMLNDPEWLIRYLAADPDSEVRSLVRERLGKTPKA